RARDEYPPRDALQLHRHVVVLLRAHQRVAVRPEMFEKKCSNGNYAAEGLQFVEKIARFGFGRLTPGRYGLHARSETSSFCTGGLQAGRWLYSLQKNRAV